jgi:predicted nuclease of predicted toxin-antitoxin system
MSLKILVDMNLSVEWVPLLTADGWQAAHWSTTGDPRATDTTLMAWALANGYIVFTHDLDFGTVLP